MILKSFLEKKRLKKKKGDYSNSAGIQLGISKNRLKYFEKIMKNM